MLRFAQHVSAGTGAICNTALACSPPWWAPLALDASWSQSLPNPYRWDADHAQEQGNNLTWVYTYDQLNRLTQARASNLPTRARLSARGHS